MGLGRQVHAVGIAQCHQPAHKITVQLPFQDHQIFGPLTGNNFVHRQPVPDMAVKITVSGEIEPLPSLSTFQRQLAYCISRQHTAVREFDLLYRSRPEVAQATHDNEQQQSAQH